MSLFTYIFQVNICLLLFYAFYSIFLAKETFFMLNRVFLVASVILSALIPCLDTGWLSETSLNRALTLNIAEIAAIPVKDVVKVIDKEYIFGVIYWTGVMVNTTLLIYKVKSLITLISHPPEGAAFSFFRYKVIDQSLPGFQTVNRHEEVHVQQMHTLDVLLLEFAGLFCWFNPVIYLYKSKIKTIHEYLADEVASAFQGDKKTYALLLLNSAMRAKASLANPFLKQSLIKKRIYMLQKEKSKRTSLLKYFLCIPLLLGIIMLTSANGDNVTINRQPEFPGGISAFYSYLLSEAKYPAGARKNSQQGKVRVGFTVDTDGSLTDIKVLNGISADLNEEAIRLIKASPKWKPGLENHSNVKVRFSVNINFSLEDNQKSGS